MIPVTVDDLAANGLLGEADRQVCWERAVETLAARKDDIAGLAVASDERIEAYVLYGARGATGEILSLRTFIEDGGARLKQLLSRLSAQGGTGPVPEGPPVGDLEGIAGDARFPPSRRVSLLRSEGAVGLTPSTADGGQCALDEGTTTGLLQQLRAPTFDKIADGHAGVTSDIRHAWSGLVSELRERTRAC